MSSLCVFEVFKMITKRYENRNIIWSDDSLMSSQLYEKEIEDKIVNTKWLLYSGLNKEYSEMINNLNSFGINTKCNKNISVNKIDNI